MYEKLKTAETAKELDEKFNGAGTYVKQDINYAELYGVHPGEKDFTGAIERSLKKGVQHFGFEMYKLRKNGQIR